MKAPTCNICGWSIKYKQVLYEDRYFYLKHKKNNVEYKFNFSTYQQFGGSILPFCLYNSLINWGHLMNHWYKFLDRVEKYNKLLDSE